MAQMKDIKRRIGSVGNIMQITNAMELVSSAKLRKARTTLETTRPYYQTVYRDINQLIAISGDNTSVFLKNREVKKRAILVVASDRGLAGGYNINIAKKTMEIAKRDSAETVVYTTGSRIIEIMRKAGLNVNSDFTFIDENPTADDSQEVGSFLLSKYESGEIDEVVVVYTKFNSVLNLEPSEIKVLPAQGFEEGDSTEIEEFSGEKPGDDKKFVDIEFEPSATAVLNQMIKQYVNVTIFGCLLEGTASEQASRRTAMENATKNGEELLEDLELVYNRARQASITNEISEIVAGAEALK